MVRGVLSFYASIPEIPFSLFKQYKDKSKRLYKTGEGVAGPPRATGTADEYATHYVGKDGPNQCTPADISNIWGMFRTSFTAVR